MTSIHEMTIEELRKKLEKLKDYGWIRSYRRGSTGIGHTMEGLLGFAENNLSIPDWGTVEIKSARRNSTSPISLLTKMPRIIEGLSRIDLVRKHGYWDTKQQRYALYTTLTATSVNSLGWKLFVNHSTQRIEFTHNNEIVAFQDFVQLQKALQKKVTNLVLIIADSRKEGKFEYFNYNEAYILSDADIKNLLILIENGDISFDWRMHLKTTGSVRDHGPAYRMQERKLINLYAVRKRLI